MRNCDPTPPERPKLTCSRAEAKRRLGDQINLGNGIAEKAVAVRSDVALEAAYSEYRTWDEFNRRLLQHICTNDDLFDEYVGVGSAVVVGRTVSLAEVVAGLAQDVRSDVRRLKSLFEQVDLLEEPETSSLSASHPVTASNRVFIIHGHDYQAAIELKLLIAERFPRLEPVLLDREAWQGRTVIEKFEEAASRCGFAFAVFTPDDNVQTPDGEYQQMRPNVVFELGWFYGKIGRSRTCILHRQGTEIPSDLAGLGWHGFDTSVRQAYYEIENELRAAFGDELK